MCTTDSVGRCDDVIVALLQFASLNYFSVFTLVSVSDSLGSALKLSPLNTVFDFMTALDFFWFNTVPEK